MAWTVTDQTIAKFKMEEVDSSGKTNSSSLHQQLKHDGVDWKLILVTFSCTQEKLQFVPKSKLSFQLEWHQHPSWPISPSQPPRPPLIIYLLRRWLHPAVFVSTAACYCSGWTFTTRVRDLYSVLPNSSIWRFEGFGTTTQEINNTLKNIH